MQSNSNILLSIAVILPASLCLARPIPSPFDICRSYVEYSSTFCAYGLVSGADENINTSPHTFTRQDISRLHSLCSNPNLTPFDGSIFGPHLPPLHTQVLQAPVPLSSNYLMSNRRSRRNDDSILQDEAHELHTFSANGFADVDRSQEWNYTEIQQEQYFECLEFLRRVTVLEPGEVYWDQDRGMDLVVIIVLLFLVLVLVSEAVEVILNCFLVERYRDAIRLEDKENILDKMSIFGLGSSVSRPVA